MPTFLTEVKALLSKEIRIELKQQYVILSLLLYVVSSIFVVYLSFNYWNDPAVWNTLFWIIILFASIHATSKSFVQENIGRQLYYYTLASPQAIICSKIIYNTLLVGILSLLTFVLFSILMEGTFTNYLLFGFVVLLGSIGFSAILTFMSAISSRSGSNFALLAILSFPILIPLLLLLLKLSSGILAGNNFSGLTGYLLVLFLLDLLAIALAYILFPYLWTD